MDAARDISNYIEANAGIFTGLADHIWAHPELSLQEHGATAAYLRLLRQQGFTVTEKLGGIDTAFCGRFGQGRPVIGILGEFDALDGLSQRGGAVEREELMAGGCGHGCGHNLLGAGALAAAFAVKDRLEKSGCAGTVVFYGCPGEEGGSGKAFLAREGLWKELDAALSWHPADCNEVRSGTNNSSIQVLYRFSGVASHAAQAPEAGRSALDAVELMNLGVQFLREHMDGSCRVHYAITDAGGVSPNVVQSRAAVLYMVRGIQVEQSLRLLERVDKIAEGAALMTETTLQRLFIDGTAELWPNFALEGLLQQCMESVGAPQFTEAELAYAAALRSTYAPEAEGAALEPHIRPLRSTEDFFPGSTDVGDVSQLCPAGQIHAVTFPVGAPGHSWQNVACAATPLAHRGMLFAGKVLALCALRLMTEPETLASVRAEFAQRSSRRSYRCPIPPDAVPTVI
ncbi:MAG: amidohydrolase [Ruminococcaceae bacterium]|nr:amidohydrolase [Oscillospiraceae bacterium]